ncbi:MULTISPECIES: urease accessory protein UreE [Sphingobacterium]|uniref:Urease accessory protein UreE n=1 Tax=Sphingobacterium populi TaxID=1812824 RepID=A0ABW5U8G1_9SPHI|nr:hypothetical protein [Sphingobacterium sp. CFCC 11742]
MILATEVLGNTHTETYLLQDLEKDYLELDWFDLDKGVLRRTTVAGREIGFKNNQSKPLKTGDVLYVQHDFCVVVRVVPCPCLFIKPRNSLEMAKICFDIGNRHVPIAIQSADQIVVAYEAPLHHRFQKQGYIVEQREAVLEQLKTLKIHQWTRKTKFKVTLSKNVNESIIDLATNQ